MNTSWTSSIAGASESIPPGAQCGLGRKYNGTLSQDGVYVWTMTYRVLAAEGVKAETLTGHVTLLR